MRLFDIDTKSDPRSTKIKVCGITRLGDALKAAAYGVEALGFIFYPPSPRNLSFDQARAIRENLPDTVSSIAVVVDPDDQLLSGVVDKVKPDFIQFHGNESQERCMQAGLPFIKAFRVNGGLDIQDKTSRYTEAEAILLDAYVPGKVGGTGETFAWNLVPDLQLPIILAGGLDPHNVEDAIKFVNPYAVDVSTGVETSAGIKDMNAVLRFIESVRQTDQSVETC